MNKHKKHLAVLLSLLLMLGMIFGSGSVPVDAADYTYTVRIFPGAQGTFNSCPAGASFETIDGQQVIVFKGLKLNDAISFSTDLVTVSDDKYYAKGIKEAGKDNMEIGYSPVTKDIDYVVAYAIVGDAVEYKITYSDTNGKELAAAKIGYAEAGDEIVIGALLIDGYEPKAYQQNLKISDKASSNVVSFVYTPISSGTTSNSSTNAGLVHVLLMVR